MLTSREDKELRALARRRERERSGRFVAEGIRVVEDLLASSLRLHWAAAASSLGDGERGRRLMDEVESRGVPLRTLPDSEFERIAGTDHSQGILAVAWAPVWTMGDLVAGPGRRTVLVLDAVQDPGNFGALVRSAEALGACGVISLPGTVDPWNAKAVRAAVGSTFRLPLVAERWENAAPWLHAERFLVLGAAVGGGAVPRRPERAALVVGNEGAGLSIGVSVGVDALVGIPLHGRAESLNVTAAAAILLHELTR